jgi:hypothetical protein
MDYLTKYYKNLSEQLQEKITQLQKLVEESDEIRAELKDKIGRGTQHGFSQIHNLRKNPKLTDMHASKLNDIQDMLTSFSDALWVKDTTVEDLQGIHSDLKNALQGVSEIKNSLPLQEKFNHAKKLTEDLTTDENEEEYIKDGRAMQAKIIDAMDLIVTKMGGTDDHKNLAWTALHTGDLSRIPKEHHKDLNKLKKPYGAFLAFVGKQRERREDPTNIYGAKGKIVGTTGKDASSRLVRSVFPFDNANATYDSSTDTLINRPA